MKSFQERNPVPMGIVALVVAAAVLVVGYNTDKLPLIGAGTKYQVNFANAAGLKGGEAIKVSGVRVGHVQSVQLEGKHVAVIVDVQNVQLGNETRASVQLETLLGQRYVRLDPRGNQPQDGQTPIPVSRTTTPYQIVPAVNQLSQTVHNIDVGKLTSALKTLSKTFRDSPDNVRNALTGLSRVSKTISKRDQQLSTLLDRARKVTGTIADRDAQISKLLSDVNPLLTELRARREAIHQLLIGAQDLAEQLHGLVQENQGALRPALEHLDHVATVLQRNKRNLDEGLRLLQPYVHLFTNTVGSGRWFDAYVCGLIPPPVAGINEGGCHTQ